MKRDKVVVMLDNGHAAETKGKCSPLLDEKLKSKYGMSRFKEYWYNREIVSSLIMHLWENGVDVYDVVPEETKDIALTTRANRANRKYYAAKKEGKTAIFISVHVNAAGNGNNWMNATGWSAWTTKGKTNSDKLAECLYDAAEEILTPLAKKIRTDKSDGDRDYEENFTVIYKTVCPSVLTENFFMDNKNDVEWLLSDEGKRAIVQIHVKGILKYIDAL